jgi:hypothetical protein
MKTAGKFHGQGLVSGLQLCSASGVIECAGELFAPDAATAYVEFFLSHTFPVVVDNPKDPDWTTLHPQTVANSYRTLKGKVFNLAHLMRKYNPEKNIRDRILGTVMAVEFPASPSGGWQVQGDVSLAPGIRGVAALHKNAEGAANVIETWGEGRTPFGDTEWTVSMENESNVKEGGFLINRGNIEHRTSNIEQFWEKTPEDFRALDWIYVPFTEAPEALVECMKEGPYIGMAKDYLGAKTLFLNGGLNGNIFYYGVALTPEGKETAARVGQILASAADPATLQSFAGQALVDVGPAFAAVKEFIAKIGKAES